ncbi:hypothetical protein ABZ330_35185 [Streptomyces sp. NPDC006172]|uniref:hypothetical protein n=1 Tax=Streptomyces sp. NPDC006172 TaxID=3154470 RepID=UPI0033DB2F80
MVLELGRSLGRSPDMRVALARSFPATENARDQTEAVEKSVLQRPDERELGVARMRRRVWWTAAALCTAAGIGLVAVAVVADLGTADQLASVSGGIAALVGLAFTVRGLLGEPLNGAMRVVAEDHSIAAGGSITAAGARSAPGPALGDRTAQSGIDIRASGHSMASGGDIIGISLNGHQS